MANVTDPYDLIEVRAKRATQQERISARAAWSLANINKAWAKTLLGGLHLLIMVAGFATLDLRWTIASIVFLPTVVLTVDKLQDSKIKKLRAELKLIQPLSYPTTEKSYGPLNQLAVYLGELPAEQRAELLPVWEKAVEANTYLLENPDHDPSWQMLRERMRAVKPLALAHRKLAQAEREGLEREKNLELEARAPVDSTDDLAGVKDLVQAAAEGRRKYRELTNK